VNVPGSSYLFSYKSRKQTAKSSHSILSWELCQFPYKKVYSLLLRNISKKHTTIYFMQYMAYFACITGMLLMEYRDKIGILIVGQ